MCSIQLDMKVGTGMALDLVQSVNKFLALVYSLQWLPDHDLKLLPTGHCARPAQFRVAHDGLVLGNALFIIPPSMVRAGLPAFPCIRYPRSVRTSRGTL